jgi:hypothetical protein
MKGENRSEEERREREKERGEEKRGRGRGKGQLRDTLPKSIWLVHRGTLRQAVFWTSDYFEDPQSKESQNWY